MGSPRDYLPVDLQLDIKRYLSYGWKPSLIVDVVARRTGFRLVHACVKALRSDRDCPPRCAENCWLRRDETRPLKPVKPEEPPPAPKKEEKRREDEYFIYYIRD